MIAQRALCTYGPQVGARTRDTQGASLVLAFRGAHTPPVRDNVRYILSSRGDASAELGCVYHASAEREVLAATL